MKRIAFLIALLFFNTWSVLACGCTGESFIKDPIGQAFKKATAVFSGKLVSAEFKKGFSNPGIEKLRRHLDKKVDFQIWILTFEVEQYWKDGETATVMLVTDRTKDDSGDDISSSCDYDFELGERYLVYAYRNNGYLKTSNCTRTQKLSQAEKDLKRLGKGKKPKYMQPMLQK